MKKFNLNHYILVQITEYGWHELEKREKETRNTGFIEFFIKAYKVVIDGEDWYKLQAHFVVTTFGDMIWATYPAPIKANILIPDCED